MPELFTRAEAASSLRISVRTIDDRIRKRTINFIRLGRRILVERTEIERIIAESRIERAV